MIFFLNNWRILTFKKEFGIFFSWDKVLRVFVGNKIKSRAANEGKKIKGHYIRINAYLIKVLNSFPVLS